MVARRDADTYQNTMCWPKYISRKHVHTKLITIMNLKYSKKMRKTIIPHTNIISFSFYTKTFIQSVSQKCLKNYDFR